MKLTGQFEEHSISVKRKKSRNILRVLLLFVVILIFIGIGIANRFIKTKGFNGLYDFVSTYVTNYKNGIGVKAESISIEIKEKDYKKLEKNREQAVRRGVIINDIDGDYVSAEITYLGKKISVKLRLKGHMTDHLQDNKWSFRIKVKEKDETIMGMKRFSIQHPGTRGYLQEWIYHEVMKREGVIALRYKFINVYVNGRDWGIYALEENFENELIENNKRLKGPIIRFNPDLYWVKRLEGLHGTAPVDEFASYYSANPEAYREDKVLSDSSQRIYYMKAIGLIEGLRKREISVRSAFDLDILARFHAVIDLVGGLHSIDWSDIKYYYNPVTTKLEPVAYESFTELGSKEISAAYKYVVPDSGANYRDWHTMIFSDPDFFKLYIKHLERLSQPEYLDGFFNKNDSALKSNLAILNKEFAFKKFDKTKYYKRQQAIEKCLNAPKSVHAYLESWNADSMVIQVGGIDALPVKIHSVKFNGRTLLPGNEIIVPSKQSGENVDYKRYTFSGKNGKALPVQIDSLKLTYSIPGASATKECVVFLMPHTDETFVQDDLKKMEANISDFDFLQINNINKTIIISSGTHVISKNLVIPPGFVVSAFPAVVLDFVNEAGLISYSPLIITGSEEVPVVFMSSDSTFTGLTLIGNNEKSLLKYIVFRTLPEVKSKQRKDQGSLTFYNSDITIESCSFSNCRAKSIINCIRSQFSISDCLFYKSTHNAVDFDYSNGSISHSAFENISNNAIGCRTGNLSLASVSVMKVRKAIAAKSGSYIKGSDITISNALVALSSEDLSIIEFSDKVSITDSEIGVTAYKTKGGAGHSQVNIKGLILQNVKKDFIREEKSSIKINEKQSGEIVKDVELYLQNEKSKQ